MPACPGVLSPSQFFPSLTPTFCPPHHRTFPPSCGSAAVSLTFTFALTFCTPTPNVMEAASVLRPLSYALDSSFLLLLLVGCVVGVCSLVASLTRPSRHPPCRPSPSSTPPTAKRPNRVATPSPVIQSLEGSFNTGHRPLPKQRASVAYRSHTASLLRPATMGSVGKQPDWRTKPREDQSPTVLGNPKNFWKWSKEEGFDMTHPPTPTSPPVPVRLHLQCELTPVVLDPAKTALLVIDMQNYELSELLGNDKQAYFDAEDRVVSQAIPAARKSGIQVIFMTTGLTEQDVEEMDPGLFRTYNFEPLELDENWPNLRPGDGFSNKGMYRNQKGVGEDIGDIELEDGSTIAAGRVLMANTWNTWLHDPLAKAYKEGQCAELPDIHFFKNRNSGMNAKMTALTEYLREHNIRTLLFTGINIDQCVMGTLQDAYHMGFDTIMLRDGCATDSPKYAQPSCEFNCLVSWGFLSDCKALAEAASKLEVN